MIFSEDKLNTTYRQQGYVVVPLLGKSELVALERVYRDTDPELDGNFYCSNWIADPVARRQAHERIQQIMQSPLRRYMPEYHALYSCFITKRRAWQGKVFPHIDWQFVEEPGQVAFNMWMPLKRTHRLNGAMWVVPGSHLRTNAKRGPNIEIPIPEDWLMGKRTVSLSAGEALIYDTRLIHGSYPNWLSAKRIALASIMVADGAPVVYHYLEPESKKISTFQVNDTFYLERCLFRKETDTWPMSQV